MAKTEIYIAIRKGGKWSLCKEVNGASRGALAFWMYLEEKYLGFLPSVLCQGKGLSRLASFDDKNRQELWDLWKDKRLTSHERLVLFTTFDKKYFLKKDIPMVAEAMKTVHEEMGGYSIFKEQAEALLEIYEKEKFVKAIAINATSVNNHIEMLGNTFNPDKLENLVEEFLSTENFLMQ